MTKRRAMYLARRAVARTLASPVSTSRRIRHTLTFLRVPGFPDGTLLRSGAASFLAVAGSPSTELPLPLRFRMGQLTA
jgi:hypothetical protein